MASVLKELDDKTGVIDIAMSPTNPDTLVVAAWERRRDEFDSPPGTPGPRSPAG